MYVYGVDNRDFPFDDLNTLIDSVFREHVEEDNYMVVFKAYMVDGVITKHLGALDLKLELSNGAYRNFEYKGIGNVQ